MALRSIRDIHILNADIAAICCFHGFSNLAESPLAFGGEDATNELCVNLKLFVKIGFGEAPVLHIQQVLDLMLLV